MDKINKPKIILPEFDETILLSDYPPLTSDGKDLSREEQLKIIKESLVRGEVSP